MPRGITILFLNWIYLILQIRMNKKMRGEVEMKYESPNIKIIPLSVTDVICTSPTGGLVTGGTIENETNDKEFIGGDIF